MLFGVLTPFSIHITDFKGTKTYPKLFSIHPGYILFRRTSVCGTIFVCDTLYSKVTLYIGHYI